MHRWKVYQAASVVAVCAAFCLLGHNLWVYGTLDPPRNNLLVYVVRAVSKHVPSGVWSDVRTEAAMCSNHVEGFWRRHDVLLTWSHRETRRHPLVVRARFADGQPIGAVAMERPEGFDCP